MMTIKEVGTYFHVSQQTVRKWVRDGELKCFRVGDVFRFSEQHIAEFIEANANAAQRAITRETRT